MHSEKFFFLHWNDFEKGTYALCYIHNALQNDYIRKIRMVIYKILKEKCDFIKSLFWINLHKEERKNFYDIRLSGWFIKTCT